MEIFLKDNNIEQLYISPSLDISNTIFKNINIKNYFSTEENALFFGMYNKSDYEMVKKHKGKKWILWGGNDADVTNIERIVFMKNMINIEKHIAHTDEIFKNLEPLFKDNLIKLSKLRKISKLNNFETNTKFIEYSYNLNKESDLTIIIPVYKYIKENFHIINEIHNKIYDLFNRNKIIFRVCYIIDNESNLLDYEHFKSIPYISYIKLNKNKERIYSRNIAAQLLNTHYIMFNDFDDTLEDPENIINHYNFIKNNNYEAIYGNTNVIDKDNNKKIWKLPSKITNKHYTHAHLCTMILTKEFYNQNSIIDLFNRNINNNIWAGEDVYFFYRCLDKLEAIYNSNILVYNYFKTGSSWDTRCISLYERYETTITKYQDDFTKNYLTNFCNSFTINSDNIDIQSINIYLTLKRAKKISLNSIDKILTYKNIFLYSIVLTGKNINYMLKILSWYLDYYCKNNNSCVIVLTDLINQKNVFCEDYIISQKKISKNIYILNESDIINFKANKLIILKDLEIDKIINKFILKNILFNETKTYRVNKNDIYCASFYLKATSELLTNDQLSIINEKSSKNLIKLKNLNYKKSNILFTGPSLNSDILKKNKNNFENSYNIAINSFIKSSEYCSITKPNIIIFSDPVFHSSPSKYTERFYNDLNKYLEKNNDTFIITTIRDYFVTESKIVNNKNIIYLTFSQVTDLNKLLVKVTGNVATGFAFPLIDYLDLTKNYLYGFTGKPDIKDETYFWEHNNEVQYPKEKEDCKLIFPAFFDISFEQYNTNHLNHTLEYLKNNKNNIEIKGKTFYKY